MHLATDVEALTSFGDVRRPLGFAGRPAEIFQKSSRLPRHAHTFSFALFLQFAILFTKTTSFISKYVIFMYLIFNELNSVCR
jgi:hypothetical protein